MQQTSLTQGMLINKCYAYRSVEPLLNTFHLIVINYFQLPTMHCPGKTSSCNQLICMDQALEDAAEDSILRLNDKAIKIICIVQQSAKVRSNIKKLVATPITYHRCFELIVKKSIALAAWEMSFSKSWKLIQSKIYITMRSQKLCIKYCIKNIFVIFYLLTAFCLNLIYSKDKPSINSDGKQKGGQFSPLVFL